jgi:hypothetical protein
VAGHGAGGVFPVAEELVAAGDEDAVGLLAVTIGGGGRDEAAELLDHVAVGLGDAHLVEAVENQHEAAPGEQVQEDGRVAALAGAGVPVVVEDVGEAGLGGPVAQVDQQRSGALPCSWIASWASSWAKRRVKAVLPVP